MKSYIVYAHKTWQITGQPVHACMHSKSIKYTRRRSAQLKRRYRDKVIGKGTKLSARLTVRLALAESAELR